jgi:hypothetical protein
MTVIIISIMTIILLYLAIGDVMLDPFPFGGGVTTLESLSVCTPVITLPSRQSVPQLAAGMIQTMLGFNGDDKDLSGGREGFNGEHISSTKIRNVLIVNNVQQYISISLTLLLSARMTNMKLKKSVHPSIDPSITNSSVNKHNIPSLLSIRQHICDKSYKIYSQQDSVHDWEKFFISVSSYVM